MKEIKKETKKQITLRLPKEVHGALKEKSEYLGISVHELILFSIDEYLNKKKQTYEE